MSQRMHGSWGGDTRLVLGPPKNGLDTGVRICTTALPLEQEHLWPVLHEIAIQSLEYFWTEHGDAVLLSLSASDDDLMPIRDDVAALEVDQLTQSETCGVDQRFGYCRRRGFLALKFNRRTNVEPCTNVQSKPFSPTFGNTLL